MVEARERTEATQRVVELLMGSRSPVADHGELVVGSANIEKMVDAGKGDSTLTMALLKLSVLADLELRVENVDSEINPSST